jgi:hypothetical protein
MRIKHNDVKLNVQGQDNEGIKIELAQLFEKMNGKPLYSEPTPTKDKFVDNLCNTIFLQQKEIARLKGDIVGMELAKNINNHIRRVDELAGVK